MSDSKRDLLPLFPLNAVLFPGTDLPLHVFEDRYRELVRDRRDVEPAFGVVMITSGGEVGDRPATADIGTSASIEVIHGHDDGRFDLVVRGRKRFRICQRDWSGPYLVATIEWLPDPSDDDVQTASIDAAWNAFVALANAYLKQTARFQRERTEFESQSRPMDMAPSDFAYVLASRLPVAPAERQGLLEISSIDQFLLQLTRVMSRERRLVSRIGASIVIAGGQATDPSA